MAILKVLLKQHTPMIHFQYDQFGASLRATELKPKFDKYLIKKFKEQDITYKPWLIGNEEHQPLNYKIKIRTEDSESFIIREGRNNQYGFFFGTIGEEYAKNPKGLTFTYKGIELEFISFSSELLDLIKNNVCYFFQTNNFGTRQSKGFGSFSVVMQSIGNKEIIGEFNEKIYKTYFDLNIPINTDWVEKYKFISSKMNLLYKAIRSGINDKKKIKDTFVDVFYFKSLMFLFAKNVYKAQWEKKTIKENFYPNSKILLHNNKELYFPNRLDEQQIARPESDALNYSSKNKYLFKDLLGLASEEAWFSYGRDTISKKQAKSINNNRWIAVDKKDSTFQRFKSPILFKPILLNEKTIRVNIFLDQESLDNALKENKHFMIENSRGNKFHIQYPNNFSLNDFFDFFLDKTKFDISTHVEEGFHTEEVYQTLKNIFEQMVTNKK